jgi:hypothetical protein
MKFELLFAPVGAGFDTQTRRNIEHPAGEGNLRE